MHVDEAIRSRKSVRRFLPTPIPTSVVHHILNVAARAPSGNNVQPWRVYAVAGEARQRLCEAIIHAATHEADRHLPEYAYYPTTWVEPYLERRRRCGFGLYATLGIARDDVAAREHQMLRNYTFFDAPVGLIFTIDKRLEIGSWLDYGMFLENFCIAARQYGLHTCAQAAWPTYHQVVRPILGIPDGHTLVCGMALGYEDTSRPENALRTDRVPASEFMTWHD